QDRVEVSPDPRDVRVQFGRVPNDLGEISTASRERLAEQREPETRGVRVRVAGFVARVSQLRVVIGEKEMAARNDGDAEMGQDFLRVRLVACDRQARCVIDRVAADRAGAAQKHPAWSDQREEISVAVIEIDELDAQLGRGELRVTGVIRIEHHCPRKMRRNRAMAGFISDRGVIKSTIPCSTRNSERWKPSGRVWRMVCSITRGPAKPMRALGSAMLRSPSMAYDAVTPPVVGSVRIEMNGRRAS